MAKTTTTKKKSATVTQLKQFATEVDMRLDRETPGTYVYKAEGDVAVTSLYIQRSHMPAGAPDNITVKIASVIIHDPAA